MLQRMIAIGDVLVADAVVETDFVCNLSACKGVCCVQGENGAPLEPHEERVLEEIFEKVEPYLEEKGLNAIKEQGLYVKTAKGTNSTPLVDGKDCAYVLFDEKGITKCGIEKAYEDGVIDFQKPVSCHLYPIRIKQQQNFQSVNYSKWEICSPACELGKQLQVPVYKFVKDALIRKYGEKFYYELEGTVKYLKEKEASGNA